MNEPICGWPWYKKHLYDYTQAEIDELSIVVRCDGLKLPAIRAGTDRKVVKQILNGIKGDKG